MEFSQPKLSHRLSTCCRIWTDAAISSHFTLVGEVGFGPTQHNGNGFTDRPGSPTPALPDIKTSQWCSLPKLSRHGGDVGFSPMSSILSMLVFVKWRSYPSTPSPIYFTSMVGKWPKLVILTVNSFSQTRICFNNVCNRLDLNQHVCHRPRRIRTAKAITLLCQF